MAETNLAAVIRLVSGQHLTPDEYTTEVRGIPYITGPADFGPRYPTPSRWTKERRALALRGDILVTVKGAGVGKTNLVDCDELAISRQLMAVRVTDADTDTGFVHLCLRAAAAHFQNVMVGSAIPGISREDVLDFKFCLPPLAEQRRIVAKVEELMGLCDALEAAQREWERCGRACAPRPAPAHRTRLRFQPAAFRPPESPAPYHRTRRPRASSPIDFPTRNLRRIVGPYRFMENSQTRQHR